MMIGVDPGISGAVCILNIDGTIREVFDIPVDVKKSKVRVKAKKGSETKTVLKTKSTITVDPVALHSSIPDCEIDSIVEKVAAMPGQGVTSMFSFGETYGVIKTVLCIKSKSLTYVRPNEWQKHFGLTMSKEDKEGMSKGDITKHHKKVIAEKAIEIYPEAKSLLLGPKGGLKDGRADAIMIARFLFETKQESHNG